MARKKHPQRHWLRTLLLLIAVPLIVWVVAFFIWFNWDSINRLLAEDAPRQQDPKAARSVQKEGPGRPAAVEKPRERITEEDRQKLEDVLKRRN